MRSCKTQRALGQVGERAARSGPAVRLDTVQGPKPEGHSVLTSAHRRAHSAKQSAPEGRRERDRLDVKAAAEADETDGSKHEHRRQHHAAAHVRVRMCASMCAHAHARHLAQYTLTSMSTLRANMSFTFAAMRA